MTISLFFKATGAAVAMLGLCLTASGTAQAHETLDLTAPKPKIALTPPMGWNSWNKFACNIDEAKIRGIADAMAASGMKDAGYQYVIIDDCWQKDRAADGTIQADPERFPSGIKALADYVHSKGLKFGLYSDIGVKTCGGRPGSRGYEFQDARTWAAWGVDYVKVDWCFTGSSEASSSYTIMAKALRASGRDIVFSICEWGDNKPRDWAANLGHLWRTTGDIRDSWDKNEGYSSGMVQILDKQVDLAGDSGPNHWNDPDMLEVGNGGMTKTEYQSHFSLWAMLAAPLIAGNDLRDMNAETAAILTNKDVIAVDQDAMGIQGRRVIKDGDYEVWTRPLKGGDRAVILFNRGAAAHTISVDWETLQFAAGQKADVTDLWSKAIKTKVKGSYSAEVAPHGVVMIRVKPVV